METIQINEKPVALRVTLDDVMSLRDKGIDVGDVDVLKGISINPLTAIDIAFGLYEARLADVDADRSAFVNAIEREGVGAFVATFRERLNVFFQGDPVMMALRKELDNLLVDAPTSGPTSDDAGQSLDSSSETALTPS